MSNQLIQDIKHELSVNSNKISKRFIDDLADSATSVIYIKPTPNMRLCIITLPSGHEVLGKAQVIDAANEVS